MTANTAQLDGRIDAVLVTGEDVAILFTERGTIEARRLVLYEHQGEAMPVDAMRYGAMLSLSQRALTHGHDVRVAINLDGDLVFNLRISNLTTELALYDGVNVVPSPHPHPMPPIGPG